MSRKLGAAESGSQRAPAGSEAYSRSRCNGGIARIPAVPEPAPVGPPSAQLRRPRPRSATGALRQLQQPRERKQRSLPNGASHGVKSVLGLIARATSILSTASWTFAKALLEAVVLVGAASRISHRIREPKIPGRAVRQVCRTWIWASPLVTSGRRLVPSRRSRPPSPGWPLSSPAAASNAGKTELLGSPSPVSVLRGSETYRTRYTTT